MSERSILAIKDKNMNRTHFLSKLLDLCASYNPVWMILMTFVTYNGVLIWRRLLTAARCEWWNGATGFAIPGSVFDPLPASAFDKPRSATDDAAVALPKIFIFYFFTFLLLNQEDTCPCLSAYAWSEDTAILILAWYTSDVFPVFVFWTGERTWLGAVFIQLKINATFYAKSKHGH